MLAAARVPQQVTDIDLQRSSKPGQGRQGRHRLAVFDFRDIGTWNLHAAGQLSLAQIAAFAKITHRARHLKTVVFGHGLFRLAGELRNEPFRFLDFKRFVAAPA
jgi:hypothetical protein